VDLRQSARRDAHAVVVKKGEGYEVNNDQQIIELLGQVHKSMVLMQDDLHSIRLSLATLAAAAVAEHPEIKPPQRR
jgi:hypothetical protein